MPIELRDRMLGDLYLTEPIDRDRYDNDDLATLTIIAVHAAQAIDRAQLFREARENQRRAEEQRDHLEVILNSMASAVLIHDSPDGNVEMVNNAARALLLDATGLTLTQLQAGKHYTITHSSGRPPAPRAMAGTPGLEWRNGAECVVHLRHINRQEGAGTRAGSSVARQ